VYELSYPARAANSNEQGQQGAAGAGPGFSGKILLAETAFFLRETTTARPVSLPIDDASHRLHSLLQPRKAEVVPSLTQYKHSLTKVLSAIAY
jgi:hypothetical protein